MADALLLTCEHGGNKVPAKYKPLYRAATESLASHRGYDPGSLELARSLAKRFDVPLVFSTVTRLLVELNRSLSHPKLFSEFSAPLSATERHSLLEVYYHPYRQAVVDRIESHIRRRHRVVHVSVHTFTPVLEGKPRKADVGLLFDPRRSIESRFCRSWQTAIRSLRGDWIVRRNYPYLGKADGLTTAMRMRFSGAEYIGVELEVNQAWRLARDEREWRRLMRDVGSALQTVLGAPF